ncbi:MAG: pyridoxamine 5'-phosphate oxidase family protein [Pseudomonadota bacterium]
MATQYPSLEPKHVAFIERQKIFFTATAAPTGRVNISPRGADAFRVLGANSVCYLDLIGSGNETAAHVRANGRMTIMLCAFEKAPLIMRLYGQGHIELAGSERYEALLDSHFDGKAPHNARQIVRLEIDMVQTSCGFGVPFFDYVGERNALEKWAAKKSDAELVEYRRQYNQVSIDGFPSGMFETSDLPSQ